MALLTKHIVGKISYFFPIIILLIGCSGDTNFEGKSAAKAKKTPSKTTESITIENQSTKMEEPVVEKSVEVDQPVPEKPIKTCLDQNFEELTFTAGGWEQGNPGFDKWIYYSDPFIIDLIKIDGDLLPIIEFTIDDFTFLLGADQTIEQSFPGSQTTQFNVPAKSFLLSDLSSAGQSGGLTSPIHVFWTKIFVVGDKTITIPYTQPTGLTINNLIPQGMPIKRYNEVKLSDLKDSGYIDSEGVLRFKFAFIPAGCGGTTVKIKIKKCQ